MMMTVEVVAMMGNRILCCVLRTGLGSHYSCEYGDIVIL